MKNTKKNLYVFILYQRGYFLLQKKYKLIFFTIEIDKQKKWEFFVSYTSNKLQDKKKDKTFKS